MAENPVVQDVIKRETSSLCSSQKGTVPEGGSLGAQGEPKPDKYSGWNSAPTPPPNQKAAGS